MSKEAEKDEKPQVFKYRLGHDLDDGQIIVIRRNEQKHLRTMPGFGDITLRLCNKQGDDALYFEATPEQAVVIKGRIEDRANAWGYTTNFVIEQIEKVPDGVLGEAELERLDEISGGLQDELNRSYTQVGALQTKLDHATERLSRLEQKSSELESSKQSLESSNHTLEQRIGVLDKTHNLLKSGNFADAVKLLIGLRMDELSDTEFMLDEIKDSGLDFEFIAKPPASLEMYVGQIISKAFGINYTDISKRLRVGKTDWDKSEIYVPVSEKKDAEAKVAALVKTIETADESVKQILVDNLGKVVDDFRKKINEYEGKFAEWQKAKEIYFAHEKAMEKGKAEIASAKGLQGCLSEIKQVKLPIYAVPEQDSITLFTPVSKGILYDSLMAAIKDAAVISSEPQTVNGNTALRITGKNGSWKPLEVLSSIRESYQNTEVGKMGGRLGLIVQF